MLQSQSYKALSFLQRQVHLIGNGVQHLKGAAHYNGCCVSFTLFAVKKIVRKKFLK